MQTLFFISCCSTHTEALTYRRVILFENVKYTEWPQNRNQPSKIGKDLNLKVLNINHMSLVWVCQESSIQVIPHLSLSSLVSFHLPVKSLIKA